MESLDQHFQIYADKTMKEELQLRIIKLMGLFEYLISMEKNPGIFIDIKKKYQKLLDSLSTYGDIVEIGGDEFDIVESVFRMMYDAPTRDIHLGRYILDRMQEIYLLSKKISRK